MLTQLRNVTEKYKYLLLYNIVNVGVINHIYTGSDHRAVREPLSTVDIRKETRPY